jgi:hypothetical protein
MSRSALALHLFHTQLLQNLGIDDEAHVLSGVVSLVVVGIVGKQVGLIDRLIGLEQMQYFSPSVACRPPRNDVGIRIFLGGFNSGHGVADGTVLELQIAVGIERSRTFSSNCPDRPVCERCGLRLTGNSR